MQYNSPLPYVEQSVVAKVHNKESESTGTLCTLQVYSTYAQNEYSRNKTAEMRSRPQDGA